MGRRCYSWKDKLVYGFIQQHVKVPDQSSTVSIILPSLKRMRPLDHSQSKDFSQIYCENKGAGAYFANRTLIFASSPPSLGQGDGACQQDVPLL
jgi:hypothetical protein